MPTLREKCPNTELFLVRIFPQSNWVSIRIEIFSPNAGKYGPEITLYMDTLHAVQYIFNLRNFSLYSLQFCKARLFFLFLFLSNLDGFHCAESVRIRSFSGPYFLVFRLNTERYSVSFRIQSEWGKIWVRSTPDTDTFHAVFYFPLLLLTALLWKKYLKTFKFVDLMAEWWKLYTKLTSQKIKFPIKDFFSKYVQIHSFLWIWSYLLNKSLMESFIFCTVFQSGPWLDVGYNNFENVVCCFGAGKLVITAASFIGFTTFANITYLYGRCYYHCILPLTKHKALVPPKTYI